MHPGHPSGLALPVVVSSVWSLMELRAKCSEGGSFLSGRCRHSEAALGIGVHSSVLDMTVLLCAGRCLRPLPVRFVSCQCLAGCLQANKCIKTAAWSAPSIARFLQSRTSYKVWKRNLIQINSTSLGLPLAVANLWRRLWTYQAERRIPGGRTAVACFQCSKNIRRRLQPVHELVQVWHS